MAEVVLRSPFELRLMVIEGLSNGVPPEDIYKQADARIEKVIVMDYLIRLGGGRLKWFWMQRPFVLANADDGGL